jgi:hypothetical protein
MEDTICQPAKRLFASQVIQSIPKFELPDAREL